VNDAPRDDTLRNTFVGTLGSTPPKQAGDDLAEATFSRT